MSCMRARHCHLFKPYVESFVQNLSSSHVTNLVSKDHVTEAVKFAADFWQPFLDIDGYSEDNITKICGPLLGILLELKTKLGLCLIYVEPEDVLIEKYFQDLKTGFANLFLFPTPPQNLSNWDLFEPTIAVGEIKMLSILSAKIPTPEPLFTFLMTFSTPCWIGIIISYFLVSIILGFVFKTENSIRNVFHKLILKEDLNKNLGKNLNVNLISENILRISQFKETLQKSPFSQHFEFYWTNPYLNEKITVQIQF